MSDTTQQDRATLRVHNPDTKDENYPQKVLDATVGDTNRHIANLRGIMAEALLHDKVVQLLSRGDNVVWGASMLAAALDYLMGMGMTHDEIQQSLTNLWEGNLGKLKEFNAIVDKAVEAGEDPAAAVDKACEAKAKVRLEREADTLVTLIEQMAKAFNMEGPSIDPDFKVPVLPHQRKGTKEILH